ncbi:MAG TPA: ATP-binding cassette domain-containing protein [Polyangiales bacterium]|nr:ATP-binding cassette domain-containing protein [Polyangiales bacterium]
MPTVIEVSGVSKRYDEREVVHELSLQVQAGQCFGLLGPNGAGKSTSLRMIYGVTAPSSGSVRVFGLDVSREGRAVRARLGVTLQDNVMIDALSPIDNLKVFGRYHLLREPLLSKRITELVDYLELGSHANVPVIALSGGFKRRLAIAMSLINEPELLILDEPTTGLDPAVRLSLWTKVRELKSRGKTVLLTTHYMDEAERLCDYVVIMAQGRAVVQGSPSELIRTRIGRDAFEVDCSPEEEAKLLSGLKIRALRSGPRLLAFGEDSAQLAPRLHGLAPDRAYILRPANLEDVFLAETGTRLEAGA